MLLKKIKRIVLLLLVKRDYGKNATKKNKYIIIDLSKKNFFRKNTHSQSFSIGQFGKIFKFLSENKCKKALFAGKIDKPKFSTLKVDFKGFYYSKINLPV